MIETWDFLDTRKLNRTVNYTEKKQFITTFEGRPLDTLNADSFARKQIFLVKKRIYPSEVCKTFLAEYIMHVP